MDLPIHVPGWTMLLKISFFNPNSGFLAHLGFLKTLKLPVVNFPSVSIAKIALVTCIMCERKKQWCAEYTKFRIWV